MSRGLGRRLGPAVVKGEREVVLLPPLILGLLIYASGMAWSQVPVTINGVPQQIVPEVAEVGLGSWSPPQGTVMILGGSPAGTGAGTSGSAGVGQGSSTDALSTLLATSWGMAAEQNAVALGVNPSALAATCVIESGCQNVGGTGTISGAFQMSASTYQSSLAAALQQDPNLAANIVPGLAGQNDPATESIAAAEYLQQGAQYLKSQGIANPSVLDVRGYYNFGPQGGSQLAQANSNEVVSDVLTGFSSSTLASNGITPGETVGQWRASVSSKIGNSASAYVLNG